MRKTRTFIAVALSPLARQRAGHLIERFQASGARVSWVEPENMHITLKFLGEQTDNDLAIICRAVTESVKGSLPFPFCCHGAGAFPSSQRPRTIWIGVREGTESLQQLQQCVERALAEQGYPPEARAYRPHLTVGRVRSGGPELQTLGRLVEDAHDFAIGPVQTDEVLVFGSHLQRGGPRYEVLARAPLDG